MKLYGLDPIALSATGKGLPVDIGRSFCTGLAAFKAGLRLMHLPHLRLTLVDLVAQEKTNGIAMLVG